MKFLCVLFAAVFAILASHTASASLTLLPAGITVIELASISNDRDASVSDIELMVNHADSVRGIYLKTRAPADSPRAPTSSQVYLLAEIESAQGVVLGQGQGVKAIFLKGIIPPEGDHGSLVIRYLANGIFRRYVECRIDLERLEPHDWQLVNAYSGRRIEHIRVQTWVLGISAIANVCPVA
jgi:hypothetical protein